MTPIRLVVAVLALLIAGSVSARDRKELYAFKREHPCPVTGLVSGACKGHVVDHIIPLCGGGADLRSNMQWQTAHASKAKDKREIAYCACLRRNGSTCYFKP